MSHNAKLMKRWNQNEVISWIESLPADNVFNAKVKQDIIEGIKQYQQENDTEVTGEDLCEAEGGDDIKDIIGVDMKKSRALFKHICNHKDNEYEQKEQQQDDTFAVNLVGQQGRPILIKGVTRKTTIREIKARFLEEQGDQPAADAQRLKRKWIKKEEGRISIKCRGQTPSDDSTLEDNGIINANSMPLVVIFRVNHKDNEYELKEQQQDDMYTFAVNLVGGHGRPIPIEGVTRKTKIGEIKARYLEQEGDQAAADIFRANGKWPKDSKGGKISLRHRGKSVGNDRTLESIGIINPATAAKMPLLLGFRVIGGGAEEKEQQDDTFLVNLISQQGKPIVIRNVTRKTKIKEITATLIIVRSNRETPINGKIWLKKSGKLLDADATLESIGIIDAMTAAIPLEASFCVYE